VHNKAADQTASAAAGSSTGAPHPNGALTPEQKKAVFRQRARSLSKRRHSDAGDEDALQVIEFTLAHERYAAEVKFVREICSPRNICPMPCTPSFVRGVINVRGQILSVMDMRGFFDLPDNGLTNDARVIIAKHNDMELGILADSIIGDRKVPVRDIQLKLQTVTGISEQCVRGVTRDRLIVMNMEKFLTDKSIVVHEEIGD
jgi:purine-binding chemotaxis protein CheW